MNPSPIETPTGNDTSPTGGDAAPTGDNASPATSWVPWSALWRYSTSQIVIYGSLATLLMPLVAEAVTYAHAVLTETASTAVFEELMRKQAWRLFAVDLYLSGLLLVIGKLLTQLFCPERIRRFSYEDDHFIFIGEIKTAKAALDAAGGDDISGTAEERAIRRIARIVEEKESSVSRTNIAWRRCNVAYPVLRWAIALLFGVGSAGIVAFLGWRGAQNFSAVLGLTVPF